MRQAYRSDGFQGWTPQQLRAALTLVQHQYQIVARQRPQTDRDGYERAELTDLSEVITHRLATSTGIHPG
ncbi:hypothetical protein [Larkinella soli]|uniref:hypothetical protein n=1 Tax=Larkinella soli TaxID=1770527 RepID=UPI000FFC5471|nr:hypothetical protein [Larkinella soli]